MCLWQRLPIGGASQSLGRRQWLNRLRPCGDRVKTAGARQENVSRDTIARRAMASAVVLALASAQAADVEQNVGRQFQALADEIERRGAKVGVAPMAISEVRRGSE